MKIKVNKHKLNIHYRGSPWGSRTQQHTYCLCYAHSHHNESHLGKKQPQVKIAIGFLFGQLHFNNVTSHALFNGGHLVMRSAKPGNRLIVEDGSNCCCIVSRTLYDSINLSLSLSSPTRPLSPSHHSRHETIDTTKPKKPRNHWHHETYETKKPLKQRNLWNHETIDTT